MPTDSPMIIYNRIKAPCSSGPYKYLYNEPERSVNYSRTREADRVAGLNRKERLAETKRKESKL